MKKKSRSIQTVLILLIIVITLIQTALFLGFIVFGDFGKRLKDNALKAMEENTENNCLYMEKELLHRWAYMLDTKTLMGQIEETLRRQGKSAVDISNDPELNRIIAGDTAPILINMLQSSVGNGAFLVLDGPAAEQGDKKAGLYIRDLDAASRAQDRSDLLLERGLPSLSREMGIALDSYWDIGFSEEFLPYTMPVSLARKDGAEAENANNYAYLSHPFALNEEDVTVMTYSVPLMLRDGSVIGVVGYEITTVQLENMFKEMESEYNGSTVHLLGFLQENGRAVQVAAVNSGIYEWYFRSAPVLLLEEHQEAQVEKTLPIVRDTNQNPWYVGMEPINIYSPNTPFESEQLVILLLRPESEVLSFNTEMSQLLIGFVIAALMLSLAGGFLAGKNVTNPIMEVIREIREKQVNKNLQGLRLKRLGISEIDEMEKTIEKLSSEVEQSSSRISHILELTGIPIGVYEYIDERTPVFCSQSLFTVLNWGTIDKDYVYMDPKEFRTRMEELEKHLWKENPRSFYLAGKKPKWVKQLVVESKDTKSTLGVFQDETATVLEKKMLEWERNYDLLTNIYNRRAFREEVENTLFRKEHTCAAMVMWDLDNLKYVNDTYGHDDGDRYIASFAGGLKRLEKDGAIICRYSGDEFATFVYDEGGKTAIRDRLDQFMRELQTELVFSTGNETMPIRASGGIAWYPEDADDYVTLIHYADFAMYVVKHSVKGAVGEFDKKNYESNYYMLEGREELNQLLDEGKTRFAFQPIADRLGNVYGYELLMRPQLTKLKGIEELLRLAKEQAKTGQVEKLTWESGMAAIAEKIQLGELGDREKLFINSIANVSLSLQDVKELEKQYPSILPRVVMEITENEPLSRESSHFKKNCVSRWKAQMAIDDFGTGYNSEGVLLEIQPNIVKVDIRLIRGIHRDENRQLLLHNILAYTKKMDIQVLAEGVETKEELEYLMDAGVDLFQGYYVARPELDIRKIPEEKKKEFLEMEKNSGKQEEN